MRYSGGSCRWDITICNRFPIYISEDGKWIMQGGTYPVRITTRKQSGRLSTLDAAKSIGINVAATASLLGLFYFALKWFPGLEVYLKE